ncbi:MAG: hypothetical protein EA379_04105 [Phycisphaerales bacterium]|nr:MAG: hypothetical protein EA379_04105 [Phycisphaerales bacterium]
MRAGEVGAMRVVAGFDAMVDTIARAVDVRRSPEDYAPMERIEQLGARIGGAAGKSINVEIAVERVKVGGNGAIMGEAMARLGTRVTFLGNIGAHDGADAPAHEVFRAFAAACERVVSLGEPGLTDALEFADGKVMLGKTAALGRITWDRVLERCGGAAGVGGVLDGAAVLAPLSWTMVPGLDAIWDGLRAALAALAPERRPRVMIDLADPAKRPPQDLRAALERVRAIDAVAPVTLGLNLSESAHVARALGAPAPTSLAEAAMSVREALGVACVATHSREAAACATREGDAAAIDGWFTPTPRVSTGAGDHFNAGYALAWGLGLGAAERLACACAVSGWYVRRGEGPSAQELGAFLERDGAGVA